MIESKIATVANMRAVQDKPGVFAFSPATFERYSATPGDYFWMPENEPLTDSEGEPMLLATEFSMVVSA